jgi:hypothetical protein
MKHGQNVQTQANLHFVGYAEKATVKQIASGQPVEQNGLYVLHAKPPNSTE